MTDIRTIITTAKKIGHVITIKITAAIIKSDIVTSRDVHDIFHSLYTLDFIDFTTNTILLTIFFPPLFLVCCKLFTFNK